MELLWIAAAILMMRATGQPLASPLDREQLRRPHERRDPTGRPLADWVLGWWGDLTEWLRKSGHRYLDRAEGDQRSATAVYGDGPDDRWWLTRRRDIARTCTRCGHGGVLPAQASCRCRSCLCHLVPARPQPSPVPDDGPPTTPRPTGGDGTATPTDPTDPTPTTPGPAREPAPIDPPEGDDPVTTPVARPPQATAPTVSTFGPPPTAPAAAPAPSGGGRGGLPTLDPSDVRLNDARLYLQQHARELQVIADGLQSREVDAQTIAAFVDMRDRAAAQVGRLNREYGLVEQAVQQSAHVAKKETYEAR